MVSFVEALYKCLFENEGAIMFFPVNGAHIGHEYDFANGKSIFNLGVINDVLRNDFREMKDDFGLLPYPKWNEEQEAYSSLIHNVSVMVTCPVSADIERVNEEVSAVIEALGSESYRRVSIPYYEMALKAAYTRDDMDAQMIKLYAVSTIPSNQHLQRILLTNTCISL